MQLDLDELRFWTAETLAFSKELERQEKAARSTK